MRSPIPASLLEFTVELWALVESSATDISIKDQLLVHLSTTNGSMGVTYGRTISISRCNRTIDTFQQIPDAVWTHVAVTIEANGHSHLFLDGAQAFSGWLTETEECSTTSAPIVQLGRGKPNRVACYSSADLQCLFDRRFDWSESRHHVLSGSSRRGTNVIDKLVTHLT